MATTPKRYYEIKYPRQAAGVSKRWIRIGSATEVEGEFGTMVLCTMESIPLNWNGEFALFPSKPKPQDGD